MGTVCVEGQTELEEEDDVAYEHLTFTKREFKVIHSRVTFWTED